MAFSISASFLKINGIVAEEVVDFINSSIAAKTATNNVVKTSDNNNITSQDGERAILPFTLKHEFTFMYRSANEQSKANDCFRQFLFHRTDLINAVGYSFALVREM
jgi:hypothetical protein